MIRADYLSPKWNALSDDQMRVIIVQLELGRELPTMQYEWRSLPFNQRILVLRELFDHSYLTWPQIRKLFGGDHNLLDRVKNFIRYGVEYDLVVKQKIMNHISNTESTPKGVEGSFNVVVPRKNKGRILASMYCKLTTVWRRSTGALMSVDAMNQTHLHNSMNLLSESSDNLTAKCCEYLGRIHAHYGDIPRVAAKIEELTMLLQQVDVEELYPIWTEMAKRYKPFETREAADASVIQHSVLDMSNL